MTETAKDLKKTNHKNMIVEKMIPLIPLLSYLVVAI